MTNFSTAVAYLLKKFWLLLAVLLVLFALVLSAARYALPHIKHNKHLLEDYINAEYGVNLSIESVHAVWERNGPSIVLNSVSLAKDNASPVALDIRQIYVELDFWESLRHRQISSNRFELRGLHLDIDADRLSGSSKNSFPVVSALERLFLEQLQSFSLEDGVVAVSQNGERHSFDVENVSWNNVGERHQGLGSIKVADLYSNSASFIVDITGTRDKFKGVLYAKAEDLDISPWVSDLINTKRPLAKSRANFEVWANITDGQFISVQAELHNSLFHWGSKDASVITGVTGGSLQALPIKNGWNVRLDQLVLNSSNESLTTDLIGSIDHKGDVLINTVKPVQVNPFLLLSPLFIDDSSEEDIRALNPKGELATLQFRLHQGKPELAAKLIDLHWSKTARVPGMSSLDLDLYWYKNRGAVYLNSTNSILYADGVLKKDLHVNRFTSDFYIYPEQLAIGESSSSSSLGSQWIIKGNRMLVDTDGVTLHPQFKLDTGTGHMSLYVDIDPFPLNSVSNLFPSFAMGTKTDNYLTRAFTGEGMIEHARVLWDGNIKGFPFNDNSGIFQAYVDVKEADFIFASNWPELNDLDLSLYFVNNALVMESSTAKIGNMSISDLSAAIPSFKPDSHLVIYAKGSGTGNALTELMMSSSIKSSLGKVLHDEVQIDGPLTADIKLDIPLRGKNVIASGTAYLKGNSVHIASTGMDFNGTSGDVEFINGDIDSENLTATFLGQPVNLSLEGRQKTPYKDTYDLHVSLDGQWHVHPLANYVNTDLADYIDGETAWQTEVDVVLKNDSFSYKAALNADLTATKSVLPVPFDTPAGTSLPLFIESEGDRKASNVTATLGDHIRFTGVLPHKEMQFSRAHLALGASDITNIGTGFSIAANLPEADVMEWFNTIKMLVSGNEQDVVAVLSTDPQPQQFKGKPKNIFGTPTRIFAKADKFKFADHTIRNVELNATQRNKDWFLDIASSDAIATVRVNSDLAKQGIEVNADYMSLSKPSRVDEDSRQTSDGASNIASPYKIDPRALPPLYFYCQSCVFHGINLGEITVDIAKEEQGLKVRQLLVKSDDADITASGYWKHIGDEVESSLIGKLTSSDVGQLLKEYGVESGIKDSTADVTFDIKWPNAPMDFGFEQLNGNMVWSLSDGYLTELSDKGSRIFTLFSLNSLVRKLSLDFRDVFAKGFFYDDMGGTLNIVDGKAYTDDTEIDGGAGEIEISGFTDLNTGELNYNVSFAPNVTGNLPFLVYFLATPPTALAALAIDQVLTSAKVISNVNYRVTGTIKDPKFDEVERNSKDISLPAQNVPIPADPQDMPLTEDDVRRLKMEVIDG